MAESIERNGQEARTMYSFTVSVTYGRADKGHGKNSNKKRINAEEFIQIIHMGLFLRHSLAIILLPHVGTCEDLRSKTLRFCSEDAPWCL